MAVIWEDHMIYAIRSIRIDNIYQCLSLSAIINLNGKVLYICVNYYNKGTNDFTFIFRNSLYHQQLRSYINQCSGWNRRCIPWSSELKYSCCDSLSCRCNFWGQNCKCVSRLWGWCNNDTCVSVYWYSVTTIA